MNNVMPTPKAEWVREGDRCIQPKSGWTGTVLAIFSKHSIPTARVRWDANGFVGTVTITTIRRAA